jgi:hypothetical protein
MRYEIVPRVGVNPEEVVGDICPLPDADGVHAHRTGAACSAAFGEIYAFVHLDSVGGKSELSTWLSRIAINAALTKIRRRRGFEFSLDEFAETTSPGRLHEISPAPDDQSLQCEIAQILVEGAITLGKLEDVDPNYFLVYDGKLLLQRNEKAHMMFAKTQAQQGK